LKHSKVRRRNQEKQICSSPLQNEVFSEDGSKSDNTTKKLLRNTSNLFLPKHKSKQKGGLKVQNDVLLNSPSLNHDLTSTSGPQKSNQRAALNETNDVPLDSQSMYKNDMTSNTPFSYVPNITHAPVIADIVLTSEKTISRPQKSALNEKNEDLLNSPYNNDLTSNTHSSSVHPIIRAPISAYILPTSEKTNNTPSSSVPPIIQAPIIADIVSTSKKPKSWPQECPLCHKKYQQLQSLKTHILRLHPDSKALNVNIAKIDSTAVLSNNFIPKSIPKRKVTKRNVRVASDGPRLLAPRMSVSSIAPDYTNISGNYSVQENQYCASDGDINMQNSALNNIGRDSMIFCGDDQPFHLDNLFPTKQWDGMNNTQDFENISQIYGAKDMELFTPSYNYPTMDVYNMDSLASDLAIDWTVWDNIAQPQYSDINNQVQQQQLNYMRTDQNTNLNNFPLGTHPIVSKIQPETPKRTNSKPKASFDNLTEDIFPYDDMPSEADLKAFFSPGQENVPTINDSVKHPLRRSALFPVDGTPKTSASINSEANDDVYIESDSGNESNQSLVALSSPHSICGSDEENADIANHEIPRAEVDDLFQESFEATPQAERSSLGLSLNPSVIDWVCGPQAILSWDQITLIKKQISQLVQLSIQTYAIVAEVEGIIHEDSIYWRNQMVFSFKL
jgi:hypothetical protein